MSFWESLKTSVQSILGTKLRSGLTILGISIGIASVVFLVGLGEGQKAQMTAMFQDLGADAIYVSSTSDRREPGGLGNLTIEDAKNLLNGPDDAATQYLRKVGGDQLRSKIAPIVENATASNGVTSQYKALFGKLGFMGGVMNPDD